MEYHFIGRIVGCGLEERSDGSLNAITSAYIVKRPENPLKYKDSRVSFREQGLFDR